MSPTRFDALSRKLSARLTRRSALRGLGGSIAATGLASRAAAQDGTPVATPAESPDADRAYFLFVQTFSAGTLQPHDTDAELYTLTLTGAAAQTVYFSDRPERIVGTVPTPQFLEGLGFTPANPPNAALVTQTDAGEDIVVVELLNPLYTEGSGSNGAVTLTYDVRILADYEGDGLAHLAERQDDALLPESFGAASLFIDECSDENIECFQSGFAGSKIGTIDSVSFCWHFGDACCKPCSGTDYWNDQCNQQFPDCGNDCTAQGDGCWS